MDSSLPARIMIAAIVAAAASVGIPADAALVAPGGPVNLILDSAFTGPAGTPAAEEPAALRKCDKIADGAKKDTDGWRFDQPVQGAAALAYVIAFFKITDGAPTPVLLGVGSDGVVEVPFAAAALTAPLAEDGPEVHPAPPGVSGGLLNAGTDGAWLRTPAGWRLAYGVLQIASTGSEPETFQLSAVCLPAVVVVPSASLSASTPVSPSASVSPSPSSGAPTLPVTGGRVAALTGIGMALVVAGLLLLRLRRRRTDVTFVP